MGSVFGAMRHAKLAQSCWLQAFAVVEAAETEHLQKERFGCATVSADPSVMFAWTYMERSLQDDARN